MKSIVFGGIEKLQISNPIISFDTVNVVYMFFGREFSSNMLFHNKSMFKNLYAIGHSNKGVALRAFCSSTFPKMVIMHSHILTSINTSTFFRAELSSCKSRLKVLFTFFTFYFSKIFVDWGTTFLKTKIRYTMFVKRCTGVTTEILSPTFVILTAPLAVLPINLSHTRSIPHVHIIWD